MKHLKILQLGLLITLTSSTGFAADSKPQPSPSPSASPDAASMEPSLGGEQVNVDAIREKYWARGDESELGVVQNRAYSKSHKFEFGVFTSLLSTDPLLSATALGMHAGYHFNEYFALQLMGWRTYTSTNSNFAAINSTILGEGGIPIVPASNYQRGWYEAELSASILYGKLSLIGKSIIYYDLHFILGGGVMLTETGNDIAPVVGIGQSIYLTKTISLRTDYRLIPYNESLLIKDGIAAPLGTVNPNSRTNYTSAVTLGIDFLVDFGGAKK